MVLEELNFLIEQLIQFAMDNFVPLIMAVAVLLYVIVMRIRSARDPRVRAIRHEWSAVKRSAKKIADNFFCTIADLDNPAITFSGEVYQLRNDSYEQVTVEDVLVPWDDLSDEEKQKVEDEWVVEEETEDGSITRKVKLRQYVREKRKNITALAMIPTPTGGQLIAFRRQGLREGETIISEAEHHRLVDLDPSILMRHQNILLLFAAVYYAILFYVILTDSDPTIILSMQSLPWYIIFFLIWYMNLRVDRQRPAYRVLYKGRYFSDESFTLVDEKTGEKMVITVPVYNVELYFHPAIPTRELAKQPSREEIYDETLKQYERQVKLLSAEKASLETRLEQANEIIKHKDMQLVAARTEHVNAFDDGLLAGYVRHRVVLNGEEDQAQRVREGPSGLDWFREFKPVLIILLILGAGYFLLQGVVEAISNAAAGNGGVDLFSTNILLGLGLIAVILLLAGRILPGR